MNARQRRDRARAGKRAAYARAQRISTTEAMRPAVGRRGKVSYQGSAAGGYSSEWSKPANVGGAVKPVVIDRRWSGEEARLTQQETDPRVRYRPARGIG